LSQQEHSCSLLHVLEAVYFPLLFYSFFWGGGFTHFPYLFLSIHSGCTLLILSKIFSLFSSLLIAPYLLPLFRKNHNNNNKIDRQPQFNPSPNPITLNAHPSTMTTMYNPQMVPLPTVKSRISLSSPTRYLEESKQQHSEEKVPLAGKLFFPHRQPRFWDYHPPSRLSPRF